MTAYRTFIGDRTSTTLVDTVTQPVEVNDIDGTGTVQIVGVNGAVPTTAVITLVMSNNGKDWEDAPTRLAPNGNFVTGTGSIYFLCGQELYYALRVSSAESGKQFEPYWVLRPSASAVAAKV